MFNPELYHRAYRFAATAHLKQRMPGEELPYLLHIGQVCAELLWAMSQYKENLDVNLAMQCALLHDTIEDTAVTKEDLITHFGQAVADGVEALSKNTELPTKQEQMLDSLGRILATGAEVRVVKMADRIVNLQKPPHYWNIDKMQKYQTEARLILEQLRGVHPPIEQRLAEKIENYNQYFV